MVEKSFPRLVLMDFDGTITSKDTLIGFIRYCNPWLSFYFGFFVLSPILILNKLRIVSGHQAKELAMKYFFKGMENSRFKELGVEYANKILPSLIRKEAADEIKEHKSAEAKIVVVTASFSAWISAWCTANDLDLIATEYEVHDEKLTGRIKGKNCNGPEKVKRIKEKYNIEEASEIYAYGDTRFDMEMLNIADVKYLRWRKIQ